MTFFEDPKILALSIGAIALLILIIVLAIRRNKKTAVFAESHGFAYTWSDNAVAGTIGAVVRNGGYDHTANWLLSGATPSGTFTYGRYQWSSGSVNPSSTSQQQTHTREFFIFSIQPHFPPTSIVPKGPFATSDNILTGHNEFDQEWNTRSDNVQFALAFLTPSMRQFFMRELRGFSVYVQPGWVLILGDIYKKERVFFFRDLAEKWRAYVDPQLWDYYRVR